MAAHRTDEHLVDGRYARKQLLGRGGFGVVRRAHDTLLERDVAIKEVQFPSVLDDEEQAALREKVLREARAAARLSHPALVTVFDVVEEDGKPLIVMELVAAPTLADRVANEGPLPDDRAATIGREVLEALAAAHSHGIIHRDVKPSNVMVGDNGRVQLADFGLASIIDDPKITSSGKLAGSPSYMAPEQANNRTAGPATDLWGLGATLYFAVEGAPPFEKDGAIATLTSVVVDDPRPMERATTLAPLLRDLLVKEHEGRPSTEQVRRRLQEIAALPPVPIPPSPTMEFDPELLRMAVETKPPDETELDEPPDEAEVPPLGETELDGPPDEAAVPALDDTELNDTELNETELDEPQLDEPPDEAAVAPAASRRDEPAVAEARRRPGSQAPGRVPATGLALVAVVAVVLIALIGFLAGRADNPASTVAGRAPDTTTAQEAPEQPADEPPATRAPAARSPASTAASSRTEGVPKNWVTYQDPAVGYTVSHPPNWAVEPNGTLTDFRDPKSGAYLRVDYTDAPGPSPEQAWLDFEPRFAAENPNYRRIRITPTTFKGFQAAIWEFTYTGRGTPLHAIDLGFVTGPYGFALNFQATEDDWDDMQDVFEAFQASFQPPAG